MTRTVEVEQTHNGKTIRRVREGRSRFYEVEGDSALAGLRLPGTSQCLDMLHKPALVSWSNRMGREAVLEYLRPYVDRVLPQEALDKALVEAKDRPEKVRRAAADYGTRAHRLIEAIVKGGMVEIPDDLRLCLDSFFQWYAAIGYSLQLAEVLVYGDGYATQIDGLIERPGVVGTVNIKTGKGPYPEHALQASAEGFAYWKTFGVIPTEVWVVRLWQDQPKFEAHQVANPATCYLSFLRLLDLLRWEQKEGDKLWV